MTFQWRFLLDLGILSLALLAATLIRSRIKFFQRFLIPNSLTAGFILLPFFNWVFPSPGTASLENIVYHFLNISFIAMTLRVSKEKRRSSRDVFATSTTVLTQYAVQCFLGTLVALFLIKSMIMPDLFPGFGLFATLGYSLGPGQAFSIGSGWEQMGFPGLGDVGLTFGALGFVWASFGGMFLVNYGIRKGWLSRRDADALRKPPIPAGHFRKGEKLESSEVKDVTTPEAIDPLTFNAAMVLATYWLTHQALRGITFLLGLIGPQGGRLADNMWGIMFIFCALMAIIVKSILKGFKLGFVIDNERMTRISGFSVDFMVAAAIAAISVAVVAEYWIPIVIIGVVIGFVTTSSHLWLSSRIFQDHVFYRTILVYGCVTGTMTTGLALLRIIDPKFETPASRDYMYSAGITFLFAIPILLTANMPALGALEGSLIPTYKVLALYALYLVGCFVAYLFLSGRRRFRDPAAIWLSRGDAPTGPKAEPA